MPAIIILAAGSSSRMGRPKQLLSFQGKTLLQHAIDTALATDFEQVILVLGADADAILKETNIAGAEVCKNGHWQEGMASSVRLGIGTLQQNLPDANGALIMLCDQPFVTTTLLRQLYETQVATGKKIAASHYKNTAGVPVFFHASLFPELLKLQGQEGAKKLLPLWAEEVALVPFAEGETDIDTEEDYEGLLLFHTPVFYSGSI